MPHTALIILALIFAASCAKHDPNQRVVRDLGPSLFEVPFASLPNVAPIAADVPSRIVCVIPSLTETICALGLEGHLVGRDRWSDWPKSVGHLPSVGDQRTLSAEMIADLRPDLVVTWPKLLDLRQALTTSFKLNVVTPETETGSAFAGILEVADALHVTQRGQALIAHMNSEQARIKERFSRFRPVSLLVVLDRGQGAVFVVSHGSFLDSLFDTLHATNAAPAGAGHWKAMSAEGIAATLPDVILDLSLGGNDADVAEANSFWLRFPQLPAVKSKRVLIAKAPVLVRPGPRFYAAAEKLGEVVHAP